MGLFDRRNGAKYIERKAKPLSKFYTKVYKQLVRDLRDNSDLLIDPRRAKVVLAKVDDAISKLDKETKKFIDKELPATYKAFARETIKMMRKMGVQVDDAISGIHLDAMDAMSDDAALRFAESLRGIKKGVQDYVRFGQQESVRQTIAEGALQGFDAKNIANEVEKKIRDEGITAFIDKKGRKWELDRYSDMLTRQVLANASRDGTANVALQHGFDLVRVTRHASKHAECRRWEGEILSLTGNTPGYPTLDEAIASGLYHVGCLHGYFVVAEGLTI